MKSIAAKVLTFMGAGAILCAAATETATAQFQSVFGGTIDDQGDGIIQARDGDFVAVGRSASFSASLDVYVVKSNRCGQLVWSRTYDISGADYGVKIRQTGDEGYIIVGSTENANHCCTRRDAFVMKIRSDGDVSWVRTYGASQDDIGSDIIVLPSASPLTESYVFAGSTSSAGAGDYDGWLTRLDANGSIIWSRVYGGRNTDGFRALDIDCNGNAVAAGYTRSHSGSDYDVYLLTAALADGSVGISNHYGDTRDEMASSVESTTSYYYIAGFTTGAGGGSEGYILQTRCGTGDYVNDITYGGNGGIDQDEFTEIKILPTGNFVLSGFMVSPPNGFGGYDAWMMEIQPNLVSNWSNIYGGTNLDQGWSVAVVNPQTTPHGLIMVGKTNSPGLSIGGEDLYEINTDNNGRSGCNERDVKLQRNVPGYRPRPLATGQPLIWMECAARAEVRRNDLFRILCSPCPPLNSAPDAEFSDRAPVLRGTSGSDAVAHNRQLGR